MGFQIGFRAENGKYREPHCHRGAPLSLPHCAFWSDVSIWWEKGFSLLRVWVSLGNNSGAFVQFYSFHFFIFPTLFKFSNLPTEKVIADCNCMLMFPLTYESSEQTITVTAKITRKIMAKMLPNICIFYSAFHLIFT